MLAGPRVHPPAAPSTSVFHRIRNKTLIFGPRSPNLTQITCLPLTLLSKKAAGAYDSASRPRRVPPLVADSLSPPALRDTPLGLRIAIVCVMLGMFMQMLDTTIANVALPYMQGGLQASRDQITWVLTS